MEQFVVECPTCSRHFLLPATVKGRKAKCDTCFHVFAITTENIVIQNCITLNPQAEHSALVGIGRTGESQIDESISDGADALAEEKFFLKCNACQTNFIATPWMLGTVIACPACTNNITIRRPEALSDTAVNLMETQRLDIDDTILSYEKETNSVETSTDSETATLLAHIQEIDVNQQPANQVEHQTDVHQISNEPVASNGSSSRINVLKQIRLDRIDAAKQLQSKQLQSKKLAVPKSSSWPAIKLLLLSSGISLAVSIPWLGWNLVMQENIRWPAIMLGFVVGLAVRFMTTANDRSGMLFAGISTMLACLFVDYWLAVREAAIKFETPPSQVLFEFTFLRSHLFDLFGIAYGLIGIACSVCVSYPSE